MGKNLVFRPIYMIGVVRFGLFHAHLLLIHESKCAIYVYFFFMD